MNLKKNNSLLYAWGLQTGGGMEKVLCNRFGATQEKNTGTTIGFKIIFFFIGASMKVSLYLILSSNPTLVELMNKKNVIYVYLF